jgi:ribonuclease HI
LGVYVNLKLDWSLQEELCTKRLIRQTNYLRHSAFSEEQCITVINKVFVPAIIYRAEVVPFKNRTTRRWDTITTSLVFTKMGLPRTSGRNYLFEDREKNGKGLISIEKMAEAVYIASTLRSGLVAEDTDTKRIMQIQFESDTPLRKNACAKLKKKAEKAGIEFVKNKMSTSSDRTKLTDWAGKVMSMRLDMVGIADIKQISRNGKLDMTRVPKDSQDRLRTQLTAYDGETLHPLILEVLEENMRPQIPKEDWSRDREGHIETWTDGSMDNEKQTGSYAVYLGDSAKKEPRSTGTYVESVDSSMEVELRAIKEAIGIIPPDEHSTTYTDSESSIRLIKTRYGAVHPRALRNRRVEKLLEQIVSLIRQRELAGVQTRIRFVYSHLQEVVLHEKDEERKVREAKRRTMWEVYGEDTERVLEGNRKADELTKYPKALPFAPTYTKDDPDYILRFGGKDHATRERPALYKHLLQEELDINRKNHKETYDWMEKESIDTYASMALVIDRSRALRHTRNFQFKLRNDRLKTSEKMYKQKQRCKDKKSRYAQKVLEKYDSPKCPLCKISADTTDHLTVCHKTAGMRKETLNTICNTLKKLLDVPDGKHSENEEKITKVIRNWLGEYREGWKTKWSWLGYMPKDLSEIIQNMSWSKEQTPLSIQKKIQIMVTEGMHECWVERCRVLNNKPQNEEKTKRMRQHAEERCEKITGNGERANKAKVFCAKTTFTSSARLNTPMQPRTQEDMTTPQSPTPSPQRHIT